MNKINIANKFEKLTDYWSPRIIAELNGQYIKLAKFKGAMVWHNHEHEDEYFHVIKGNIVIHLRDKSVSLSEGECFIVPRGVEHKPEALEEAHVMIFEPKATAHTGTTISELTLEIDKQHWI